MKHQRNSVQKNFQCEFCPTRNTWVKLIMIIDQKRFICPECIAELARQVREEKQKIAAVKSETGIQKSSGDPINTN